MTQFTRKSRPDQKGTIAVITGANSGIGLETARALAEKGATAILACRNMRKANEARVDILKSVANADVHIMELDLSDMESIHSFSKSFGDKFEKLDLLINNAGVMALPFSKTKQGFETTFGTNHLGHFALTGLLLPRLRMARGSRVVTLSSLAHVPGKIDFENLNAEKGYSKNRVYSQSKLANLLFAFELDRRLKRAGVSALSVAAHPGWTITGLQANTKLFTFLNPFFGQQPVDGALPTLLAATSSAVSSGDYYGPQGRMELRGGAKKVKGSRASQNAATAKRLWEVSETLTGVSYL
jgi:NAD(P)-dependent dehydrogenase (short-subunit alcohol dehydrogenase family)